MGTQSFQESGQYDGVNHHFVYDAENRIVSVDSGIGYIYDAEGRRVGKTNGTVYTVGTSGQVLDEVDGTAWKRSEVYVGSRHLATVTSTGVTFTHSDWLGTERARTNAAGMLCESTSSSPFGDNVQQSGTCNVSPQFFTGKPRDTESNLDDSAHATSVRSGVAGCRQTGPLHQALFRMQRLPIHNR